MALFAITLFVSAFLLFLVQPLIGKMILPRLGGTPQVWNTCMVFFQAALLAGYAYTHTVSTRLSLRRQLTIHAALLFIPFVLLFYPYFVGGRPFDISGFLPPPGANPIPYTLFHLTLLVGLPFFVVATSAPLLQKWFAATGHPASKDPYFLYGASNLGSMLALLAYPFIVEPNLLLKNQAWMWAIGYGLLLVLVLVCAALVWQSPGTRRVVLASGSALPGSEGEPIPPEASTATAPPPPAPSPASPAAQATAIKKAPKHHHPKAAAEPAPVHRLSDELTTWRKLRWIGLAAVPSSLMLGITTHITTDLSPIPLIWLIPLTLYLISFILVFSRWPVVWTDKPHTVMLYGHPVALAIMIFVDITVPPTENLPLLVFCLVLGFFWTAMVCHGELARDRPSTKHLTEFYLMMSVGGVVGGIFNGLLAPIIFPRVWEFPIAIAAAGLLRPRLRESGWTDDFVGDLLDKPAVQPQHHKKGKHQPHPQRVVKEANPSFHLTMDLVLPGAILMAVLVGSILAPDVRSRDMTKEKQGVIYFCLFALPLIVSCFYYGRPLRYGLAISAVLFVHLLYSSRGESSEYSGRSYFGVIRVSESAAEMPSEDGRKVHRFMQLMHGTTDHGMNFVAPANPKLVGNPLEDYSRLATTYYHQLGPVGRAMERFNWFTDKINHYHSDARMPMSLIGMGAFGGLGAVPLPASQLVTLWSEPPYATIGLGTGTMAAYSRPYQHMHFYEIDNLIRRLSLPEGGLDNYFIAKMPGKAPYFTYLRGALKRGANIQVLMGDARLRMAQPYKNYYEFTDIGGGPEKFYHLMVVDAFSSDAIPVHLITKEAIEMYFEKLVPDGVLCVHTSNRHVDLVRVVADVCAAIKWKDADGEEYQFACKRGHDIAPGTKSQRQGHYTSEWVMVARHLKYLEKLDPPPDYREKVQQEINEGRARTADLDYWTLPRVHGRYVWTDDYSNLLAVLRVFLPPE